MQKQTRTIVCVSLLVAIIMFGFSFALAPLYNTFCKVTGISRLPTEKEFLEKADLARSVKIQFVATNNENLPWEFFPRTTTLIVHPNETARVFFHAKNLSSHIMTAQAIPSFTPGFSSQYFHKIECFCFTQQTLQANESKDMLVVFRIGRELPHNINTITLAYTLFNVASEKMKRTSS